MSQLHRRPIRAAARRAPAAALLVTLAALPACAGNSPSTNMGGPMTERTAAGDVAAPAGATTPGAAMPGAAMPGAAAIAMPTSPAEMFTDASIAASASVSNMSEILPSRLALEKSQNEAVRAFAQRMIDEHTRLETQMQALLQQKGVAPAHNAFSYQVQQNLQPMMQELQAASGAAFDVLYVGHLVSSHMTTLHALDTSLIPHARDAEMKAMLQQQARPAVAQHYQEVLRLQAQLGGSSGGGTR